jgi:hypothetical protein
MTMSLLQRLSLAGLSLPLLLGVTPPNAAVGPTAPPPPITNSPTPYPSPPRGGALVMVPGGTEVDVQLTEPISSSTANVGDTFGFRAVSDVVVNGWIIVAKGAPGVGEVLTVDRAGSHGHPGSLALQMDWVFATDGEKLALTNQRTTQEGESKAGVSSTMTILSYVFLGPVGLFAHNFVKGRDVVVDDTHTFQEYVSNTVHVIATAREVNSGFAH